MSRLGTVHDDDPGEQLRACLWLRQALPAPLEASISGFADGSADPVLRRSSVACATFGGGARKQGRPVSCRFRLHRSRHRSSRCRKDHGNDFGPGIYWYRWGFPVPSSGVVVDRPAARMAMALSGERQLMRSMASAMPFNVARIAGAVPGSGPGGAGLTASCHGRC
jgi:hypothetical protein